MTRRFPILVSVVMFATMAPAFSQTPVPAKKIDPLVGLLETLQTKADWS